MFGGGIPSWVRNLDVVDKKFSVIHKTLRQAANGINSNVKYIVVGDSTRNNTFNEMIAYYTTQLAKINVTVLNNAESGQSGYDWAYNIDQTTLAQCLALIGTNESNCIVEFSHGINDYKNGATQAQVKAWLSYGITQLLTAKPNVIIVLCTPIITSGTERNGVLKTIYQELAAEFNLPLIDCTIPTTYGVIQGNTNYYQDGTHPNKFGSQRVVNYILNAIVPTELLSIITLEPYIINNIPSALTYTTRAGFWLSTGLYDSNAAWRSMNKINVEPNFVLEVIHQGNRTDVCFYTENDVFISRTFDNSGSSPRVYTIPSNAWKVGINITSEGTTWDALNDVPIVRYQDPSSGLYLNINTINTGLKLKNAINKFRNGILVDDYGLIGTVGQSLKIDSNNKMKWSV